jgi:hypothetical protein
MSEGSCALRSPRCEGAPPPTPYGARAVVGDSDTIGLLDSANFPMGHGARRFLSILDCYKPCSVPSISSRLRRIKRRQCIVPAEEESSELAKFYCTKDSITAVIFCRPTDWALYLDLQTKSAPCPSVCNSFASPSSPSSPSSLVYSLSSQLAAPQQKRMRQWTVMFPPAELTTQERVVLQAVAQKRAVLQVAAGRT